MSVLYLPVLYNSLTHMHTLARAHTHTHTHTWHIHTHTGSTSNSPLSTEEITRIITHYSTLDSVSWKHSTLSLEVLTLALIQFVSVIVLSVLVWVVLLMS